MMAVAQLLNIRMPGSYEVIFPPQNLDMPVVDGPGKGPDQSGRWSESIVLSCCVSGSGQSQQHGLRVAHDIFYVTLSSQMS